MADGCVEEMKSFVDISYDICPNHESNERKS